MTRLTAKISGILLALSVAACGSGSSSTSQQGGAGASTPGSGGNTVGNTNLGSGGSPAGGNGSSLGNSGGSAVGAGGSAAGNTGGMTIGAGGSIAAATGGTKASTTATGGTNASATGGTSANITGGTTAIASGGGSSAATGGQAAVGGTTSSGASSGAQLITSALNDYFNTTKQATVVATGTATLTVDASTTYQRWDGFGGCFNEMGWDALSVVSSAEQANALKLLFDAKDGANFTYGRLPMGASDYSMSWYTLDDTAGDYAMSNFSIARDLQKLIPFIKAALQVKSDVRLWASPWVVPSWMMDSSSNMKSDAQTLGAHALYMAKFVEEYAKQGLKIEAIHPQNEPGYARVHWTQALLIDFIKTYLGPTFAQRNLTTEIWCGTMSKSPADGNIAIAAAADSAAMKYIKGFGLQWNLKGIVGNLSPKGAVMQTEHRCGNYNFDADYWDKTRYDANKPQNDHAYGEESWQLIRDWVTAGVNSYAAWNMVLDTVGKSLDAWPQNSLLVVDRTTKKVIQTPAYYVFRQFSQFILPGATRIAITGSNDALAFKNADGSIIAEIYNKATTAQTHTVKVGSAFYQCSVPSHGWATLRVVP